MKNKTIVFLIILISITFTPILRSQNYSDWVLIEKDDTIACKITLINEYNVFYEFKDGKKVKNKISSKLDLIDYLSNTQEKIEIHQNIDSILFYGYDFSNFKIIDEKRTKQDIVSFIMIWTEQMELSLKPEDVQSWMNIGSFNYNLDYINNSNLDLNSRRLVTKKEYSIHPDSVQSIINKYPTNNSNSLGFTIIYEYFSNYYKTISAYYVFFDTRSKKILQIDQYKSKSNYSYNRVKEWGFAMFEGFKNYSRQLKFNEEIKRYQDNK